MPKSNASSASADVSFANNFWGKDDAGVEPLIQRMANAKTTCDELKNFYSIRAAIEEDYAKKLLSLSRKPFGSCESGSLKASMDVLRAETESSGKAHQNVALQIKTDLEEPLARFSGAMRERRKIVQGGIEKLLKVKIQQTQAVNKTRDRYEQDCLRIKGYLAQGHMVQGQEERKNKAKLEKTQASLQHSNADYQNAVKALQETTERWNKQWREASDVFQDLDEDRIDKLKSSMWTFVNIAATVCVSDDQSCEKVRVALENCEVDKDITSFIADKGTGSEIPDAPKYINFSRGDVEDEGDTRSEAGDSSYSIAQFSRPGNYRRPSSASKSTYSEATENGNSARRRNSTDSKTDRESTPGSSGVRPGSSHRTESEYSAATSLSSSNSDAPRRGGTLKGPSSQYPPNSSPREQSVREDDQSSIARKRGFFANSPFRRKSKSEKREREQQLLQKQMHQRQQTEHQKQRVQQRMPQAQIMPPPQNSRNPWGPEAARGYTAGSQELISPTRQSHLVGAEMRSSPEPLDPRTSFQLNVGENVFDVAPPDNRPPSEIHPNQRQQQDQKPSEEENTEMDPIAQALAELKGVGNTSNSGSVRKTADRYYGITTPAPASGGPSIVNDGTVQPRGNPPPTYMAPKRSALDAPAPAHTSAAMQQTLRKYRNDTEYMLDGPPQMPAALQDPPMRTSSGQSMRQRANTVGYDRPSSARNSAEVPRAPSPNPPPNNRSVSPRPQGYGDPRYNGNVSPKPPLEGRGPSPNPYQQAQSRPSTAHTYKRGSGGMEYYQQQQPPQQYQQHAQQQQMRRTPSPNPMAANQDLVRNASPASYRPYTPNAQALVQQPQQQVRPRSQHSGSFSQMDGHSGAIESFGRRGRNSYYDSGTAGYGGQSSQMAVARPRSKSVVDTARSGSFARDGRPILYYARAMYAYQAMIPEELSFQKGDTMAVLRVQDDGWWEAEVEGQMGGWGLVPSNYLQQV
ncbi:hypothetical protein BGX38DRAFT_1312772 [Terfezia claveryi]|nr:hypothetical protein BGX38DRAFT_1312772 [Terfezia claveryi]